MKKKYFAGVLTGIFIFAVVGTAQATSIVMEGDYVKVAVSDDGTLGYGHTTDPGLLHDADGLGVFTDTFDYLTPGSPWEIFSVSSSQSGVVTNNNDNGFGNDFLSNSLTNLSSTSVYDNYLRWQGADSVGLFTIVTDYFYNDGDERINLTTTITAVEDLSELYFLRAIDPDQDADATPSSHNTINGLGFDANGDGDYDDLGDLAAEDWVHSVGSITGLTLGLYSDSEVLHNTGVTNWSADPLAYNGTVSSSTGDHTIGIAFSIGNLGVGESIALDYAYVMGDSLETVDIPNDPVPEPATMVLFGAGLAGLVGSRIRKKKSE